MMDAQSMQPMGWAGSADGRHTSPTSQISPSHFSAAESLAYMQGGGASRTAAWPNGAAYPPHAAAPIPSTPPAPAATHHSSMGNGGYHFPPP